MKKTPVEFDETAAPDALDETAQLGQTTGLGTTEAVLARTVGLLEGVAADARVAPTIGSTAPSAQSALAALGADASAARLQVDLGRTLGAGGMGVVHVGTQRTLLREVAVKTLRDDVDVPASARRAALQEAWVNGALQHPNIVPIHDLGLDAEGRPVIVMKRIEGRAWADLIEDSSGIPDEDRLGWHLRTLVQVCHAVEYAHSQGIIHRDIKPDNVMVGAFGEVYLLDWGIAVALEDDGTGRFPIAPDRSELAGTPVYLAPEMLGEASPEGDLRIDPRADVYLLGATLYHAVLGEPPHLADSREAVVERVIRSDPPFPPSMPSELAAICRRAMAADRERRFPTARAFREAVERFLAHRASAELAAEAQAGLARLEQALAQDARQTIYAELGACRFGFQQALRDWPDNAEAALGLAHALKSVARWELAQGDDRAAQPLLDELGEPGELAEELAAVRAARLAREAEADALRASADTGAGAGSRAWLFVPVCLMTLFLPVYELLSGGIPDPSPGQHLVRVAILGSLMILGGFFLRRRAAPTQTNQMLAAAAAVTGLAMILSGIGNFYGGGETMMAVVSIPMLAAIPLAVVSAASPLNLWPTVIALTAMYLVCMEWPALTFVLVGPVTGVLLINAFREARRLGA